MAWLHGDGWRSTAAIYTFYIHLPQAGPVCIEERKGFAPIHWAAITEYEHKQELTIAGLWAPWMEELRSVDRVYFWSQDVDPDYWHHKRTESKVEVHSEKSLCHGSFKFVRANPRSLEINIDEAMARMGFPMSRDEFAKRKEKQQFQTLLNGDWSK